MPVPNGLAWATLHNVEVELAATGVPLGQLQRHRAAGMTGALFLMQKQLVCLIMLLGAAWIQMALAPSSTQRDAYHIYMVGIVAFVTHVFTTGPPTSVVMGGVFLAINSIVTVALMKHPPRPFSICCLGFHFFLTHTICRGTGVHITSWIVDIGHSLLGTFTMFGTPHIALIALTGTNTSPIACLEMFMRFVAVLLALTQAVVGDNPASMIVTEAALIVHGINTCATSIASLAYFASKGTTWGITTLCIMQLYSIFACGCTMVERWSRARHRQDPDQDQDQDQDRAWPRPHFYDPDVAPVPLLDQVAPATKWRGGSADGQPEQEQEQEEEEEEQQQCSVCISPLVDKEQVRTLPCSHPFHDACITPWVMHGNNTCPNCRAHIFNHYAHAGAAAHTAERLAADMLHMGLNTPRWADERAIDLP